MKRFALVFAVLLAASNLSAQVRPPAIPPTSTDALKLLGEPTRSVNIDAMVARVLKNSNPAARKNLINFTRRTLTNPADLRKFDAAIAAAIGPGEIPQPATATPARQQPAPATSPGTPQPQNAPTNATVQAHDIPDLLKQYSALLDRKRYLSHDDAAAVLSSRSNSDANVAALKTLLQNKAKLAQEESTIREKLKLAAKYSGFSEALLDLYGDRYRQAIAMEDLVRQQDPQGLPIARKAFSEAEKDLQNHPLFVQLQKQEQSFSTLSNSLNKQQRSGQPLTTSQLDQLQQAAENAFAARKKLSALMGSPLPQPESIRNEAGGLLANRRLKAEASPSGSPVASSNPRPVSSASSISPSPAQPTPTAAAPRSEPINRPQPTAPVGIATRPRPTVESQPVAQPQPAAPALVEFPQGYPVAAFSAAQAEQLQALGQQYGFPPYQMLRHPYTNTAGLQYMFELAQYVRTAPDYSALTKAVASLPQEHKESLGPILDSLRNDQPVVQNSAVTAQPQPATQPVPGVTTQPQLAVAKLPPDYPTSVLTAAQQEQLAALGQQYGFPPYAMLHHPFAATTTLEYIFQLAKYVRDAADKSAIGLALQNVPPEHHESFGALLRSTRPQAAPLAEARPQRYGYEQNGNYPSNAEATEPSFADQPPQEYDDYHREPTEPTADYAVEGSHPPEEPFPSDETFPAEDYDVADEPPVHSEEALEQLEYGTRSLTARRPTNSQPTIPAEWTDPVFNRLVDITLLARGIQEINSEFLTSAALQFQHAEHVLQRSHRAIAAEDLFRRAVDVALSERDSGSLDRLRAAATAADDKNLIGVIDSATQLNAGSRTMTSDTVISLDDLTPDQFALMRIFGTLIQRAKLIRDKETIQSVRKQIKKSSLPSAMKNRLLDQLTGVEPEDSTATALKQLSLRILNAPSRQDARSSQTFGAISTFGNHAHSRGANSLVFANVSADGAADASDLIRPGSSIWQYGTYSDDATLGWFPLPGLAQEISVGGDGSVYLVATSNDENEFGFGVYKWAETNWEKQPGDATKIAIDRDGNPWLINKQGNIWRRFSDGTWQQLPGQAQEIAIGGGGLVGNESVYIVATAADENEFGFGVYKWTGNNWARQPGDAVKIAVDLSGNPWLVNKQGSIWRRWNDGQWQHMPGLAREISIGKDGSVYIVATDEYEGGYGIYQWQDTNWAQIPGSAVKIGVHVLGQLVAIKNDSTIHVSGPKPSGIDEIMGR